MIFPGSKILFVAITVIYTSIFLPYLLLGQDLSKDPSVQRIIELKNGDVYLKKEDQSIAYFTGFVEGRLRFFLEEDFRDSLRHYASGKRVTDSLSERKARCLENAKQFLATGMPPSQASCLVGNSIQLSDLITPALDVFVNDNNVYTLEYSFVGEECRAKKCSKKGALLWQKDVADMGSFLENAKRIVMGLTVGDNSVVIVRVSDDFFCIQELRDEDGVLANFVRVELE